MNEKRIARYQKSTLFMPAERDFFIGAMLVILALCSVAIWL